MTDNELALRLMYQMISNMYFDYGFLRDMIAELSRLGRIRDDRKGIRVVNYASLVAMDHS